MKIIDNTNRRVLSEGRNHQMGFAFCKKIDEDNYELVHPISPCKDYLSDVLWTEHVGKPISCCGLKYEKQGIYDGEVAYMAIKICDYMSGNTYAGYEADRKRLRENFKNLEMVVNHVEAEMALATKTSVLQTEDADIFLLKLPHFWCQFPYLVSLYSLLVRVAQYYDGKKTPKEFLEGFSSGRDMYLWQTAKSRLAYLVKCGIGEVPKQEMVEDLSRNHPHSSGIIGFSGFKNVEAA